MTKIILPIDTKSLYMNIKNDNEIGHTATVNTPLRQGNSYNEQLGKLLEVRNREVYFEDKPELIKELSKSSKSKIQIKNVFVFDKISVNGISVDVDKQYCIYIKEEVDSSKVQFGRQKVHYPVGLKYCDIDIDIDNKSIIKAISDKLFNYAFIVKSFEYDTITGYLNFNVLIVGENGVPYSKVFINERGAGNKFTKIFNDTAEDYDLEIIPLKKHFGELIDASNYLKVCTELKEKAVNEIYNLLTNQGAVDFENVSADYPYSLFDIQYKKQDITRYAIVVWTATNLKYFNMSIKKNIFCHKFSEYIEIYLVSDILNSKNIKMYTIDEIDNLNKVINSLKFVDEGE